MREVSGSSMVRRTLSQGRMRFWCPIPSEPQDFVCAYLGGARVPLHLHENWQFAVPSAPATLGLSRSRHCLVQPGTVTAMAPYQVHTELGGIGSPGWHLLYVAPEIVTAAFRAVSGDAEGDPGFRGILLSDPVAAGELMAISGASEAGILTRDEFVAETKAWLLRLVQRHALPAPAPVQAVAERVRAFLQGHVSEPVALATLAAVAGLNSAYLVRSFAKSIGLPPHRYHTQLRVARAARLLAQGTPATWVAYECGFADQAHLCRRFKEIYGLTPGDFRAQHRRPALPGLRAA